MARAIEYAGTPTMMTTSQRRGRDRGARARPPRRRRPLAVGHSPTNEAAVYGLTGERIAPMGKGEGVLVVADGEQYRVEPLG